MDSMASWLKPYVSKFATEGRVEGLVDSLITLDDGDDSPDQLYLLYLLAKMMESHSVDAAVILGEGYLSGQVLAESPKKAKALFEKAADSGNARGMFDLGMVNYFGHEFAWAVESFEKCLRSQSLIESKLGLCYGMLGDSYYHLPVPQYDKAKENLAIAADKYHVPFAVSKLGQVYLAQTSAAEKAKGIPYLKRAAIGGDAEAACALAKLYVFGDEDAGISPDLSKAEELLYPHADSDNSDIQMLLAHINLYGVDNVVQGAQKAVGPLEQLWSKNHRASVANELGLAYYRLDRRQEAREMWEYAAKEGFCDCFDFLGRLYVEDLHDYQKGLGCYDRAYNSGVGLSNMFAYAEYIQLLVDAGRYQDALLIAQEGSEKYNDIEFVFQEANLALSGKCPVDDLYHYVQAMRDCALFDGYASKARRVLADYYMRIGNRSEARIELKALYDMGDKDVAYSLGVAYAEEPLLAVEWFTRAFEDGNVEAALRLAELYERMRHREDTAYEWYSRAADAGSETAAKELLKFKRTLTGRYKRMFR